MQLIAAIVGTLALVSGLSVRSFEAIEQPRAIEFDMADAAGVRAYRIEVVRRDDARRTTPVLAIDVPTPAPDSNGRVRLQFDELRDRLANGEYVLFVSAIGASGKSPRSAPSEPFIISNSSVKPGLEPKQPPEAEDPAPTPAPPPETEVQEGPGRSRLALIIGIIIGAAALLVPMLK